MDINVSQRGEGFLFLFMVGIKQAEVIAQLREGILGHVHLPDTFVVGEEWKIGRRPADTRLQRGAGYSQRTALAAAQSAHPRGIDFGETHHNACHLRGIKEDLAVEQLFRLSVYCFR